MISAIAHGCASLNTSASRRDGMLAEVRCDFEFVTFDLREIDPLYADQAGLGLAPRRMHIAFIVNVSLAGGQIVGVTLHDLAGFPVRRLFDKLPVGHFRD